MHWRIEAHRVLIGLLEVEHRILIVDRIVVAEIIEVCELTAKDSALRMIEASLNGGIVFEAELGLNVLIVDDLRDMLWRNTVKENAQS